MSSIQIKKNDVQVQMEMTNTDQLTPLEQMLDQLQEVAGELVSGWIKAQQKQRLTQLLGAPWQPLPSSQRGLACPRCGGVHLRRKSWLVRTVKVARLGEVSVPRRKVSCQDCGNQWMPFEAALRLPDGSYGPRKLSEGIDRVVDMSYQKAADADPQGPSAATLHRLVQQADPQSQPTEAKTMVVDGTDVPAWRKSGQLSLTVAHQIEPAHQPVDSDGRPPTRERQVLGLAAGAESDIKAALEPICAEGVIHDGKLDLSSVATHEGRCRWHISYTSGYLLYRDGIKGESNRNRKDNLKQALNGGQQAIDQWLSDNEDAPTACTHVRASLPALQQMQQYPEAFTVQTTSHLEREMVELNKRFENGGGWTSSGAEHLLRLHQLHRHEPQRYTNIKQTIIEQTVS